MAAREAVLVDTQTAITATTQSAAIPAPAGGVAPKVAVVIDVTVGTAGTLTISLEWSQDGGVTWAIPETAQAFGQIGVATPKVVESFDILGSHYRFNYMVATGPYTLTARHFAVG